MKITLTGCLTWQVADAFRLQKIRAIVSNQLSSVDGLRFAEETNHRT